MDDTLFSVRCEMDVHRERSFVYRWGLCCGIVERFVWCSSANMCVGWVSSAPSQLRGPPWRVRGPASCWSWRCHAKASRFWSLCREAGEPSSGCNWSSWEENSRRCLPSALRHRHRWWAGSRAKLSVWLETATCCRCRGPCQSSSSSGSRWPPCSRWLPHRDNCTSATLGVLSNSR